MVGLSLLVAQAGYIVTNHALCKDLTRERWRVTDLLGVRDRCAAGEWSGNLRGGGGCCGVVE